MGWSVDALACFVGQGGWGAPQVYALITDKNAELIPFLVAHEMKTMLHGIVLYLSSNISRGNPEVWEVRLAEFLIHETGATEGELNGKS